MLMRPKCLCTWDTPAFWCRVIRVDIAAAGRGLSQSHHDVWREGLEIIRIAREQGAGRNEVMAFLRSCEHKLNRGFGGETGEKSE